MSPTSPGAEEDALLAEAAQSLAANQAHAEECMRHALHAIRAATSRQPHVRVEYRVRWVSVMLALLLGLALFPLTAYVALPAWREHRDYAEHEFMIAELKKIPSAINESPPPE